jgi:hypothetical protein
MTTATRTRRPTVRQRAALRHLIAAEPGEWVRASNLLHDTGLGDEWGHRDLWQSLIRSTMSEHVEYRPGRRHHPALYRIRTDERDAVVELLDR